MFVFEEFNKKFQIKPLQVSKKFWTEDFNNLKISNYCGIYYKSINYTYKNGSKIFKTYHLNILSKEYGLFKTFNRRRVGFKLKLKKRY